MSSTSTTMSDESNDTRFSLSSARSDTDSLTSAESWRPRKVSRKPPPVYQQTRSPSPASMKPSLETIPASPPPPFDSVPEDEAVDGHRRSISFASFGPPRPLSHVEEAEFDIPSDLSIRRLKMERLRRKLGDDVPVDLVFPDEERTSEEVQDEDDAVASIEETRRWTQQERSRRQSADLHSLASSPLNSAVVHRPVSMSRTSPSTPSALSRGNSTASAMSRYPPTESKLKSGFSLARPLFAVVEPDDYITGCFEFSLRKHRAAYIREFGKQQTLQ